MFVIVLLLASFVAAYLAGRSWFWHVVFARMLIVMCGLWIGVVGWISDLQLAPTFLPVVAAYFAAIILRWVFSPRIPQVPLVSFALTRIAITSLLRHFSRNIDRFAGRENFW